MKRRLDRLTTDSFDIVVVGGGINGACVAWDATLRGLSVALVEKRDFGWSSSANMHRILHGGFRYLRNADVKRIRESVRERNAMMRLAPHLTGPMPVLVPTYRSGIQHREFMRVAIFLYELLSFGRNRGISESHRISSGRIVSRAEVQRLAPDLVMDGVTGGAIWQDGALDDPARLVLEFIRSANDAGACVANYVEATGYLMDGERVCGVRAIDKMSGAPLEIRGRLVVNACGPWTNHGKRWLRGADAGPPMRFVRTVDVVTRPLTREGHGLAFTGPQPGQPQTLMRYFIAPWRGYSVIGSVDYMAGTDPDDFSVAEAELQELLLAVRLAMPGARLGMDDILAVQAGLIPHEDKEPLDDPYNAARHYRIVDHERVDGARGLISIVGIKYTTARDVAEKAVDLALRKLGKGRIRSVSSERPLHCGDIGDVEEFLAAAERRAQDGLDPASLRVLARLYGSKFGEVLSLASANPAKIPTPPGRQTVIAAQIVHAVRNEMAVTLSDVVARRTPLAADGHPGRAALAGCAEIMATELGWDAARVSKEIAETEAYLKRFWTRATSAA